MRKLPIIFFLFLFFSALCTSIYSYRQTESAINKDVCRALAMTMERMPCDVITTDTIRCYRNFISIEEIRDTAYIAMRTVKREGRLETEVTAEVKCGFCTIFMLSEQKAPAAMGAISFLGLIASCALIRRSHSKLIIQGLSYGGIVFCENCFLDTNGNQIHLTPMQYELMKMFFLADNHTLSKQDICNRLWPQKDNACETLYTLIRRLKPILATHGHLKIESDRGKSYILKNNEID